MKGLGIDLNSFSRWFRKRVRDPFVEATGLTDPQKFFLERTLPMEIHQRVTRIENQQKTMAGDQKMSLLVSEIKQVMTAQNLRSLMPVVKMWLEQSVLFIYREHFVEKFKKVGLNDWLESYLHEDLDDDGKIAGKQTSKSTGKPAKSPESGTPAGEPPATPPDDVTKSPLFAPSEVKEEEPE